MNEGSPDKPFDRACIKTLRSTSLPHSWTESRGIGDIFVNCHYLRHHSAEASIECGKLIREPSDQCCKVLVRHVTVEESTQGAEPMHHLGDRGQKKDSSLLQTSRIPSSGRPYYSSISVSTLDRVLCAKMKYYKRAKVICTRTDQYYLRRMKFVTGLY